MFTAGFFLQSDSKNGYKTQLMVIAAKWCVLVQINFKTPKKVCFIFGKGLSLINFHKVAQISEN